MIRAPWTADQVASLNAYQACGYRHPFTYDVYQHTVMGQGFGAVEKVDLIATPAGWVAKEGGPVVQDWAHEFMTDWSWRRPKYPPDTEYER